MADLTNLIRAVEVLHVRPGDLVVLHLAREVSTENAHAMREALAPWAHEHGVTVACAQEVERLSIVRDNPEQGTEHP